MGLFFQGLVVQWLRRFLDVEEIAVRFCAGPYFKMDFDKGQHFLIDKEVITKIIKVAKLSKKDNVIEIGAGTGNLTKHLA